MPDVRRYLRLLRQAGAPGAAAAGVPADRRAELEAELEPVFAGLAGTQKECAAIRDDAARRAGDMTTEAAQDAARLVADAAARAPAIEEEALAAGRSEARAETRRILAAARRDAGTVAGRAAERTPALTAEVVAAVRRMTVPDGGGSSTGAAGERR